MHIKQYIIILLLVGLSLPSYAQITIGVDDDPSPGAILDLKTNTIIDGANSNKGLLLPRLHLKKMDSLEPILNASEEAVAGERERHTGLTVYNIGNESYFCPGMYVWSGEIWEPSLDTPLSIIQGDNESNSFIIPTNSRGIDIPISKAYKLWKTYQVPAGASYGFNSTNAINKNIDLNTLLNPTKNNIRAELVWMDAKDIISNTKRGSNELMISDNKGKLKSAILNNDTPDDISDDYIRILTNCNSSSGNAVISLLIDEKVYWSWHIWITDYDPNKATANNLGEIGVKDGNIYRYNNTSVADGNIVFMDRNLGSINPNLEKDNIGLYYQWGRKDPFPSLKDLDNSERKLYNGKGQITTLNIQAVTEANNLANSIHNPFSIYSYKTTATNTQRPNLTYDWYTSESFAHFDGGDRHLYMNDYLWDDGGKTDFDPCPKGWKTPTKINANAPWFSTKANGQTTPNMYTENPFTKGYIFNSANLQVVTGNYPAGGYISAQDQTQNGISNEGRLWTATSFGETYGSYSFQFSQTEINPWATAKRAHAYSVRCVQE